MKNRRKLTYSFFFKLCYLCFCYRKMANQSSSETSSGDELDDDVLCIMNNISLYDELEMSILEGKQ